MAKLKFDRSINLKLKGLESTKIPQGEVWRVEVGGYKMDVNGVSLLPALNNKSNSIQGMTLGGGTEFKSKADNDGLGGFITGVAFKIIN